MEKKSQVNIFLPFHISSGNRGCEAITRATAEFLGAKKDKIFVLTNDIDEDKKIGLDRIVCLEEYKNTYSQSVINVAMILGHILHKDFLMMARYYKFLKLANHGDFVMITGGDLYCYPELEWQLRWVCSLAKWKKCKLILWGCSIDEKRLEKKLLLHLKRYDKIYVRETYTRKNLESRGISKLKQIPDPAFRLKVSPCSLPEGMMPQKIIGINVSNYTNQNSYSTNTTFCRNIFNLIKYILESTNFQILMIPHVFWKGQDDRILLKKIYNRYKKNSRVFFLDSEKLSYCQIRFAISQCYMFVGSRTHSVISAYATGVPALALGYSIKSKGIAFDLQLPKELVVDCTNLKTDTEIVRCYQFLEENYLEIKNMIVKNISIYYT